MVLPDRDLGRYHRGVGERLRIGPRIAPKSQARTSSGEPCPLASSSSPPNPRSSSSSATCCAATDTRSSSPATAQEGFRRWATDRPDLIALDTDLPGPSRPRSRRRASARPRRRHPHADRAVRRLDRRRRQGRARCAPAPTTTWPSRSTRRSCRPGCAGLLARFARSPMPTVAPAERPGRVHAYYGAKGGVGTTTLAINTAIALHSELKRSVALVDAQPPVRRPPRLPRSWARHSARSSTPSTATAIDADVLRRVMVRHDSGVDLLLAPADARVGRARQRRAAPPAAHRRAAADDVRLRVVDLDKHLDDHMLDVIGAADRLVVVMTADLSCLKNVRLVLETMASARRARRAAGAGAQPRQRVHRHQHEVGRERAASGRSRSRSSTTTERPSRRSTAGTPFMDNRPDSALGRGGPGAGAPGRPGHRPAIVEAQLSSPRRRWLLVRRG